MFEEFRKQLDYTTAPEDHRHDQLLVDGFHEEKPFLGMSPAQRFIFALLFLMMTVILGVCLLIVTHRSFLG